MIKERVKSRKNMVKVKTEPVSQEPVKVVVYTDDSPKKQEPVHAVVKMLEPNFGKPKRRSRKINLQVDSG